jgi:hypothetical protein
MTITESKERSKNQEVSDLDNPPKPHQSSSLAFDRKMLLQAQFNARERIARTEAFRSKHTPKPKEPGHYVSSLTSKDSFRPFKDSNTNSENTQSQGHTNAQASSDKTEIPKFKSLPKKLEPAHSLNSNLKDPPEESSDTPKEIKPAPKTVTPALTNLDQDTHKDFSLRPSLIIERIWFELIMTDSSADIDVRTKALLVFAKFINIDLSRKILTYNSEDKLQHQMLESHHDLPQPADLMSKYVSSPMLHPRTKRLVFHTRF